MKVILLKTAFKCPDPTCRLSGDQCAKCFAEIANNENIELEDILFDNFEKVDLKHLKEQDTDDFLVSQVLKRKAAWTQKTFKVNHKEKVNGKV